MSSRYSGPNENDPSRNGPVYVEQSEFDSFKGRVLQELGSIQRAITEDARSRARRDAKIEEKLDSVLQSRNRSDPPKFEDLTGRFRIERQEILKQATVRGGTKTAAYSGIGVTVAMTIIEIFKAYFQTKGH